MGGDVSVEADVQHIAAKVTDALGPIDILIANAGITRRQDMDEITEQDFNEIMQANLTSAFLCAQAVVPGVREHGWGRLIFVGSGAAHNGGLVGLHYSAAKGGIEALASAYARPLAEEGVTSNCVVPTLIETDMTSDVSEKAPVSSPPVGRTGHVDEVVMAAVMLAANGYMTGQTVHMNGGLYFT